MTTSSAPARPPAPSSPQPSRGRRRDWLLAGVGVAAGVAGAGWAWWKYRPHAVQEVPNSPSLWSLRFDAPEGNPVAMEAFKGRPLLVNFWATWCPPCIEELPMLDAFFKQNSSKGWQVLGLAIDQPSSVRKWLAVKPLSFPIGMAGLNGTELAGSLGNIAGGLPFTAVFDSSGAGMGTKMGKLEAGDLTDYLNRVK